MLPQWPFQAPGWICKFKSHNPAAFPKALQESSNILSPQIVVNPAAPSVFHSEFDNLEQLLNTLERQVCSHSSWHNAARHWWRTPWWNSTCLVIHASNRNVNSWDYPRGTPWLPHHYQEKSKLAHCSKNYFWRGRSNTESKQNERSLLPLRNCSAHVLPQRAHNPLNFCCVILCRNRQQIV